MVEYFDLYRLRQTQCSLLSLRLIFNRSPGLEFLRESESPLSQRLPQMNPREFWKFFTRRPQIGWNLRKKEPKYPLFLWLLSLKDLLFFALHAHV